ncbi:hypothetical protein [Mediterranea massiliensis]|uniref:hypothetical protein n=1 Tax=Mediterranea massiliensis TaxID=1841865 RepID=UPI0025A3633D|nr:hypothetical protein [Mediterranea massiliensis]MDM8338066.1 hypothetical protein [Mediterranea massiliensis]
MTRAYYDTKPPKLEAVGNVNYLYRWDIQEEEVQHEMMQEGKEEPVSSVKKVQYSCREVTIHGKPEYGKCVEAVIRSDYSAEAELALINQFNAYQQGVLSDAGVVSEYEEYLAFVSSVKSMVKEDLEIDPGTPKTASAPRMADIAKLLMLTVNTMSLTDNDALSVKSVYPEWETLIGKEVKQGDKMQCDGRLWKVLQQHTVQEQWRPGTGTESLYTEIVETASGTADDPIPYNNNMELEQGKYYIQDGITYLCTRNTEIPVYQPLADLVGIYVELYSESR